MSKQQTIFEGFEVPVDKTTDKMLLGKLEKPLQTNVSRGVVEIYDEVERVFAEVKTLLPYIKEFELITTKERLKEYLQTIIENGVVALDTETDGLNPISDRIAGFSLYTYNENPAYVPINHDYFDSNVPLEIASAFINALLKYNIKVVMHNARFDIRVFWNALGVKLNCHFDTMIAAKLLNENEPENGLKALWTKYGSKEGGRSLRYNELFSGVKFTVFDPSRVVIYPALDGLMTLELYDFQSPYLDKDNPICKEKDLVDTASLFYDIEMPTIHTAVEMEQRGIALDVEYASRLEKEYTEKANTHKTYVQKRLIELMPQMKKNLSSYELSKLSNPINLDSPQQLQIVFYQGLQIEIPSKKVSSKEGSVDAEVIKYIAENYKEYADIAEGIIEYKGYIKNLNTYITALPAQINPKTNRLHTSWNTIGADTGRFSSREPNL